MSIAQALLPEFDREMATTRTLLEVVPEDAMDWKPHPKSMDLGTLANHISTLPRYGQVAATTTEFDPRASGWKPPRLESRAELLKTFDDNVREARASVAAIPDEDMMAPFTLRNGGVEIFTLPRAAVLRTLMMNHIIHHRGQLSVYLRLRGVPLPSIYGPTADTM